MKYKFLILFFMLLISAKSFAVSEVTKNLNLSVNNTQILSFDEKIISYKLQNNKDFRVEVLSGIFNSRQELLIKPLKKLDNKLTVWTASKIYNFVVDYEIPKTTVSPVENCGMVDFNLDNPPKLNDNRIKETQGVVKLRELP